MRQAAGAKAPAACRSPRRDPRTSVKGPAVDRREFLKTAVAAPLAAGFTAARQARSGKPNLLFLWADQQRPDTMRVYGNTQVHAPNFNKLADECVVFQNPYSTQPVCTPARSSVLTGLWPHTNGCVTNGIQLPKTTPAFPELLADSDYRTGYFGKWHLGDELFPQHGFEEWVSIEDIYGRSFSTDRDRDQRSTYDQFLRERGFKPDLPEGQVQPRVRGPSASRVRQAALPRAEDDGFSPTPPRRALRPLRQLPRAAPALRRAVQRPLQARRDRATAELRDPAGRGRAAGLSRQECEGSTAQASGGNRPQHRRGLAPDDRELLRERHTHRRRHRRHPEDARRARIGRRHDRGAHRGSRRDARRARHGSEGGHVRRGDEGAVADAGTAAWEENRRWSRAASATSIWSPRCSS